MWIDDILEILTILHGSDISYDCCVQKIENNIIYFTNGKKIYFSDIKEICNIIEFKKRFKEIQKGS